MLLHMLARELYGLVKDTMDDWMEHNAHQLAAALAYYALFSIAPLVLIAISIVGLVLGPEAARAGVMDEIQGLIGEKGAQGVEEMLEGLSDVKSNAVAGVLGLVLVLFGATTVFTQLRSALNTIWEAQPGTGGLVAGFVKDRLLSFALVVAIGFLLLVSLIMSTVLNAMGTFMTGFAPGSEGVWEGVNFIVSAAVVTVMFALIYKFIPEAVIHWRDVWIGALISALLFSVGKSLIGYYLGRSAVASAYGAAGAVVVLLIWVYYSSLLVLLGAEFTHVQATRWRRT
ncbi:MAG: YihY/virulence factor BrkB family protein [Candidatus Polarisedimenticolia bacterium]